ncbi:diguanylate cyclase [Sulfitobacter sp. HNIBRBA3233]|uniref:diguanylate cyclase n=1 Tax=Sulfitobacter marinivivus TaxID=3158558 RepID=UPI0032DFE1FA
MLGKILVVDAISTNRIVLKVKLAGAFYDVLQAASVEEAILCARSTPLDLIVTALSLPDGSSIDLCRRIRQQPRLAQIPVLAVGNAGDAATRLDILAGGASDVMQRPLDETLLLGRVRSLIRANNTLAEFQVRDETTCALGLAEPTAEFVRPGHVMLVGEDARTLKCWVRDLHHNMKSSFTITPLKEAMAVLHAGAPTDAIVLALPANGGSGDDCLRLISALRASTVTRHIGVLTVQQKEDVQRATTALDLGADDVMVNGFESRELALRLKVLLRHKAQMERVHQNVRTGLQEVVHDPLTGLYNRRFAMPHLARIRDMSLRSERAFAVILGDMDHFKQINDAYGHASGDAVLVETAQRLRDTLRGVDMIARIGGEEFLMVLPGSEPETAHRIAERLRAQIGNRSFAIPGARAPITVTMSMGLSTHTFDGKTARCPAVDEILDSADKALYAAKVNGRNQIALSAPLRRPAA